MEKRANKIIVTRKIWQLIAATAFVLLITLGEYYPFSFHDGMRLGGCAFLVVFNLTYLREERRATHPPDSNLVINWNLAEAILLLASLLGYFVFAYVHDLEKSRFYAVFRTATLGLLGGVAIGEFVWQNTQLRRLDETCQQRYWATYKNSIF